MSHIFNCRNSRLTCLPRKLSANDIRKLRHQLKVSQPLFAKAIGVTKQTINSWESGWRTPSLMACKLLTIFKKNPQLLLSYVHEK